MRFRSSKENFDLTRSFNLSFALNYTPSLYIKFRALSTMVEIDRRELNGVTPAIASSNDSFAVFFWLSTRELQEGRYVQGCEGRVNLHRPQRYALPNGREDYLPEMKVEPRGSVALTPGVHSVYYGYDGIEQFFNARPEFKHVYWGYINSFLIPHLHKEEREPLSA